MLCLVIAQSTGWMTGLWSCAYTSSVLVVPAHIQLCPLSGALLHAGSVTFPTGCPSPWLIQVCQDGSLRTPSSSLAYPASNSSKARWSFRVFIWLVEEALVSTLPRTPCPMPQEQAATQHPRAEHKNLALLSCPHSISAYPVTQTPKPCTNCWPSTGTSKHPTWSFLWLVVPKTSLWSHACARSSADWFTSHSLKVRRHWENVQGSLFLVCTASRGQRTKFPLVTFLQNPDVPRTVCISVGMCTWVQVSWRVQKRALELEIQAVVSFGYWVLDPGPLQEQYVLIMAEPSLQPGEI